MSRPVRSASIRRTTVFALLAEGARAICAAALVLSVTRILGPGEYGLFALALSFGTLALLASDFGVSPAAARFIAERRGDAPAAATVLGDALRLKIVFAGLVSAGVFAVAGPLADVYGEPDLAGPLRATAALLFAQSLFTLFTAAFVALGRTNLQFVLYASEGALELGLVIAAAVATGGAAESLVGRGAAFTLAAAGGLVIALRLLGRRAIPRRAARSGVRIAGYAGVLFVIDAAYALLTTLDVLMIGAYLGPESVGQFEAPLRLTLMVLLLGVAASSAIAPRLARTGDERPDPAAAGAALRGLLLVGLLAGAVALAWAEPLVDLLLGDEYEESSEVLRALAPFIPLALIAPLATVAVNYLGQAARRVPLVLGAVALNVIVNVILIPRIGIVSGALATLTAYVFYVPAHLLYLRSSIHLRLRPLALTGVRGAVAAGAAAGVLALLGTDDLAVGEWIAGAVLAPVVFGTILLATREVTRADLRALRALVP